MKEVHDSNDKVDSLKYFERKLVDTGAQRLERHSAHHFNTSVKKPPPKKGHGGKFTWEGPDPDPDNELEAVPALDEGDPNFVDEEQERKLIDENEDEEVKQRVKGEVEVPKVVDDNGVSRVELHHASHLNV
ncbi:39S ribosomal protein L23 mitochondrial [Bienertia sinuspersici]